MAMSYKPQNGDVKLDGVTVYPYDYKSMVLSIKSTDYVISADGSTVTCFLTLENDVVISGVFEQHYNKNEELFKTNAYNKARERAFELGYKTGL
jgi:hypothetical protein